MDNNCLFCKIASGEIPSNVVYEDERILCFHDINKMAKEHVLVIPKLHISSVNDVDESNSCYIKHIFENIPKIVESIGIKETGYRLVVNTGDDACQSVKHLHVHVLGGEKLPEKIV